MAQHNRYISYKNLNLQHPVDPYLQSQNKPLLPETRPLRSPNSIHTDQRKNTPNPHKKGSPCFQASKDYRLEQQKIELIRNFIKEQLANEKKLFKKMILLSAQQLKNSLGDSLRNHASEIVKKETAVVLEDVIQSYNQKFERLKNESSYEIRKLCIVQQSRSEVSLENCEAKTVRKGKTDEEVEKMTRMLNQRIEEEKTRVDKELRHINSRLAAMSILNDQPGATAKQGRSCTYAIQKETIMKVEKLDHNMVEVITKLENYNQVLQELVMSTQHSELTLGKLLPRMQTIQQDLEHVSKDSASVRNQFSKLLQDLDEKHQTGQRVESELAEKVQGLEYLIKKRVGKNNDIFQAMQELNERVSMHSKTIQNLDADINMLKDDFNAGHSNLSKIDDRMEQLEKERDHKYFKLNSQLEESFNNFKTTMQNYLEEMVDNYNINFEALESTNTELQEFNLEVVTLIRTISAKLCSLAQHQDMIKSSILTVQEVASASKRDIRQQNYKFDQLTEKGFELEHQLKLLKEKIDYIEDTRHFAELGRDAGDTFERSRIPLDEDGLDGSRQRKFEDGSYYHQGASSPVVLRSLSMDIQQSFDNY